MLLPLRKEKKKGSPQIGDRKSLRQDTDHKENRKQSNIICKTKITLSWGGKPL